MKTFESERKNEIIIINLLVLSIVLYGLFHESHCAFISAVELFMLMAVVKRNKGVLFFGKSLDLSLLGILPFAALISAIYAVDSGMALLGAVKFLPLLLFILLVYQLKGTEKGLNVKYIMNSLPFISAAVTVITLLLYFTPLRESVYINDRFSGSFQYANSFALLLLISLIIVLFSENMTWKSCIIGIIHLIGIILAGTRTVFILMLVSIAVWIVYFLKKEKRNRLRKAVLIALGLILLIAFLLLISVIMGEDDGVARFIDFDFSSSSFTARILYNLDGTKMLLEHPFGMGYKGFLFAQGGYQTGNYSATYVHNELLQTGLDFGVLVMVAIFIAYIFAIKSCKELANKMILIVSGLHCLFDWSFQFLAILFILILVGTSDEMKKVTLSKMKYYMGAGVLSLMCVLSLWIGTACQLEHIGDFEKASKIYPGLTISQMNVIGTSQDETKYELAEAVTSRNDYCVIALQAMAEKAIREGDFEAMVEYGDKSIEAGRYNTAGYELYIDMLNYGINVMDQMGNQDGMIYMLQKTAWVEERIEAVKAETSPLAENLSRSSKIELGKEYVEYLKQVNKSLYM